MSIILRKKIFILILLLLGCSENNDQKYKEYTYTELPNNNSMQKIIKDHLKFLKNNQEGKRAVFDSLKMNNNLKTNLNWSKASFIGSKFSNIRLDMFNFTEANFTNAYFDNVDFSKYSDSKVILNSANFRNVVFEPKTIPSAMDIIATKNLFTMRYNKNPTALIKLKNEFRDSGFLDLERQIIHALMKEKTKRIDSFLHRYFRIILFSWTSAYGMEVWRPILLLLINIIFFAVLYFFLTMFSKKSRISAMKNRHRGDPRNTVKVEYQIWVGKAKSSKTTFFRAIFKLISYSILFSLMSAFNYGFREINFGRWIRNLLHEDIDIKSTRWARTASGIQSILCLYLFALWLLIYFSSPFEQLI